MLNIFCEGMVIVMVINGECVFVNSIVRLHGPQVKINEELEKLLNLGVYESGTIFVR